MVFIAQNVFGVKASIHKSDQTTHGDGWEQEFIWIVWLKSKETLSFKRYNVSL